MFWTVRLIARLVVGDDPAYPLHHIVGAARDIASGLDQVLEIGPVREDRRQRLSGAGHERGGARLAAGERDRRHAGQALIFEARTGVGADRRIAVDLDNGDNPSRILRQQADFRHLADAKCR